MRGGVSDTRWGRFVSLCKSCIGRDIDYRSLAQRSCCTDRVLTIDRGAITSVTPVLLSIDKDATTQITRAPPYSYYGFPDCNLDCNGIQITE